MDYTINVSEKVKLFDSIQLSVLRRTKTYYKKRPWILILNIALTIISAFIHPIVGTLIGLIAIFVLPSWKEKT